jgi:uncharacterized protein Yka (UPF0111/DUF47 family)
MLGLSPRKGLFDLLNKLAQPSTTALGFCEATYDGFDSQRLERIKIVEHEGDQITHDVLQVTKSFVTPLDREDIHQLAVALDDILDLIDAAISRIFSIAWATDRGCAPCAAISRRRVSR